jgi:DinB superfamily
MASHEETLREELVFLLERGNAHMSFEQVVADYPMEQINTVFANGTYTAWHLLEHLRRTQWDILDFIRDPQYQEREWPMDYWPAPDEQASEAMWRQTIDAFLADRAALRDLVRDPRTDLYAPIPHGSGQNVLREILVVSDHNAYHVGEFAIMRQVLGTWGNASH